MKNDIDFMRIFDRNKLIGVLNFNNMIPVNDHVIRALNLRIDPTDSEAEKAYKILCIKELDWIRKHQSVIIKRANKLYRMITSEKANARLKKRCLDFLRLGKVLANRCS